MTIRSVTCAVLASLTMVTTLSAQQAAARTRAPGPALPPAPFEQPEFGATFRYDDFSNRILGGEGFVTRYVDNAGRGGARFGIFFVDNAARPLEYNQDSLAALFPLSLGKRARFVASRGQLEWLYDARVVDTERITTPAGTFDTWVVETIEAPKRTRSPALARTHVTTFWYAPSVRNIVRLMVVTTTPGGVKELRRSQLRSIEHPRAGAR